MVDKRRDRDFIMWCSGVRRAPTGRGTGAKGFGAPGVPNEQRVCLLRRGARLFIGVDRHFYAPVLLTSRFAFIRG